MTERHMLGDLTLAVTMEPRGIVVEWLGKSTSVDPEALLSPYLGAAAVRAMSLRMLLIHDFTKLQFFNSSTLSTLIRHLRDLETREVQVHVRYARTQRWQRTFFDALGVSRQSSPRMRIEAVNA